MPKKLKPAKDNPVTAHHVRRACRRIDEGERPPGGQARSTFLLHQGKKYPAKAVRRLALEEATGVLPEPDSLSGGVETVRFFEGLGFDCSHQPTAKNAPRRRANDVVIARVQLDMGVSQKRLLSLAKQYSDHEYPKGAAHRRVVRDAFRSNREGYLHRLERLVRKGVEAGAQIVVLPAVARRAG